jgi:hypothetical protein
MTEGLRKHSTTLFKGSLSHQQTSWSGLLNDHKNLTNHQLSIVADGTITTGVYAVHIIPDDDDNLAPVNTGLVLDLTANNSAMVNFTGVIRGVYLIATTAITPTVRVSAVLSSFSRQKRSREKSRTDDTLEYFSSLTGNGLVGGFVSHSQSLAGHSNLVYHQLSLMSDIPITDQYKVRIIPDTDDSLETSVDTGFIVDFGGTKSAIVYFGAVLRGLHLEAISVTPSGAEVNVVLSSSIERSDEVLFQYMVSPPDIDGIVAISGTGIAVRVDEVGTWATRTLTNLQPNRFTINNPDGVAGNPELQVNNWLANKTKIEAAESAVIDADYEFIAHESFDVEGELDIIGDLVVLGDVSGALSGYVTTDGLTPMLADWDIGPHQLRAETMYPDVVTGTAPLTVESTTKVGNLNADRLDDYEAADLPVDAGYF